MKFSSFAWWISVGLLISHNAVASAQLTTVPLPTYNERLQTFPGAGNQFPEGNVTLGGIPFSIPSGAGVLNIWDSAVATGSNPRTLVVPVNLFGVQTVYSLVNTIWGSFQPAPGLANIQFNGSLGASYTFNLVGNSDVRDFLFNVFTNSINNTTTTNVFSAGSGFGNAVRLDMQTIILPPAFLTQTLTDITFTDNGGTNDQRIFVAGLSVATVAVPEPSTLLLVGSTGLIGVGVYWKRRRKLARR